MEIVPQRYWRRLRGYKRLNESSEKKNVKSGRKRVKMDPTRKRRFWRIKIMPKLRILKTVSFGPKKIFTWLRDAYVNMMLRFADSRFIGSNETGYGYGYGYGYGSGLVKKEYDEKVLVEIYKSILMAQGNYVHRDTSKVSSDLFVSSVS